MRHLRKWRQLRKWTVAIVFAILTGVTSNWISKLILDRPAGPSVVHREHRMPAPGPNIAPAPGPNPDPNIPPEPLSLTSSSKIISIAALAPEASPRASSEQQPEKRSTTRSEQGRSALLRATDVPPEKTRSRDDSAGNTNSGIYVAFQASLPVAEHAIAPGSAVGSYVSVLLEETVPCGNSICVSFVLNSSMSEPDELYEVVILQPNASIGIVDSVDVPADNVVIGSQFLNTTGRVRVHLVPPVTLDASSPKRFTIRFENAADLPLVSFEFHFQSSGTVVAVPLTSNSVTVRT